MWRRWQHIITVVYESRSSVPEVRCYSDTALIAYCSCYIVKWDYELRSGISKVRWFSSTRTLVSCSITVRQQCGQLQRQRWQRRGRWYIITVVYEPRLTFQGYITAGVWSDYNGIQRCRLRCNFTAISNRLAATYLRNDIINLISLLKKKFHKMTRNSSILLQ